MSNIQQTTKVTVPNEAIISDDYNKNTRKVKHPANNNLLIRGPISMMDAPVAAAVARRHQARIHLHQRNCHKFVKNSETIAAMIASGSATPVLVYGIYALVLYTGGQWKQLYFIIIDLFHFF
jgi:hypothetical protein